MPTKIWFNGEWKESPEKLVHLEDRGMTFGDGIYEVVASLEGQPLLIEEHLDRWERSSRGIRIQSVISRETRKEIITQLASGLPKGRGFIYGQMTRGAAPRLHSFPVDCQPTEYWFARPMQPLPSSLLETGISLVTKADIRWARCDLKSLNLLPNCLAKQEALDEGADDAVFLREEGKVTECTASNIFAVVDGVIRTHPLTNRILAGVVRNHLIALLKESNRFPVEEVALTIGELRSAEEIFVTSTTKDILPVTQLDHRRVGNGAVGPFTMELHHLLQSSYQKSLTTTNGHLG